MFYVFVAVPGMFFVVKTSSTKLKICCIFYWQIAFKLFFRVTVYHSVLPSLHYSMSVRAYTTADSTASYLNHARIAYRLHRRLLYDARLQP